MAMAIQDQNYKRINSGKNPLCKFETPGHSNMSMSHQEINENGYNIKQNSKLVHLPLGSSPVYSQTLVATYKRDKLNIIIIITLMIVFISFLLSKQSA